jgi:ribosomal protein L6P/L9E
VTLNSRLNAGFFIEMELIGLGFRIKKIIPSVYRFFWGYANYVYLFTPKEIMLEYAAEERSIFFFSLDSILVNNFATYLMLLKKLSVYRVTGFVKPGKIILLNSGKQR